MWAPDGAVESNFSSVDDLVRQLALPPPISPLPPPKSGPCPSLFTASIASVTDKFEFCAQIAFACNV